MLLLLLLTLDSVTIILAPDFKVVADNDADDIAIVVDDVVASVDVDSNNIIILIVVEWQIRVLSISDNSDGAVEVELPFDVTTGS